MGSWVSLGRRLDAWFWDMAQPPPDTTVQFEEDGWDEAADARLKPRTKEQIIAALEKKNSYRMWRIRHDLKWLKRQLKKMGYNPEDARELL